MKKVFWLMPCTVLCISLYAEDIHISENYKKHYCKEIQKIYYSNPSNLKSDLLTGLKAKASQLGANSIVRVEFTHSIFSNNTAEGIAANCDISKSPEFFLKSPLRNGEDIRQYSDIANSEGKIFVGIGITKGKIGSSTGSANEDSSSFPITIGYITDNNIRVKLSSQTFELGEDKVKLKGIDLDFDKIFQSISNDAILQYVGVGLGFYKVVDSAQYYDDNKDLSGKSFNFNAGILIRIDKNSGFEVGYKFKSIQFEEKTISGIEIDNDSGEINSLYIGLNYKF